MLAILEILILVFFAGCSKAPESSTYERLSADNKKHHAEFVDRYCGKQEKLTQPERVFLAALHIPLSKESEEDCRYKAAKILDSLSITIINGNSIDWNIEPLRYFSHITSLHLERVRLSTLESLTPILKDFQQLTELHLEANNIQSLEGLDLFAPSLKRLNLMGNQVRTLAGSHQALEVLYLQENPVRSIESLEYLPKLKQVGMGIKTREDMILFDWFSLLQPQKAPPVTCFKIFVGDKVRHLPENKYKEISEQLDKSNSRIRTEAPDCR